MIMSCQCTQIEKNEYKENGGMMQLSTLMTNMSNKYLTLIKDSDFNQLSKMDRKIITL